MDSKKSFTNGKPSFKKLLKALSFIFLASASACLMHAEGIYITDFTTAQGFQELPPPKDKEIPVKVKYFNDPEAEIDCADLKTEDFTSTKQDFNPGFYKGVLWINVDFPDTQAANGQYYNLGFGLKRFNYADVFRYSPDEGKWILMGRTGYNLDKSQITYATWIPSVLIDESEFPDEEIHTVRIRMVSYNGNPVSLKILPSSVFDQKEKFVIIFNSFFIALSVGLFILILFLGIFIKDKLYIIIGAMTGGLYLISALLRGLDPTTAFALIKNGPGLIIPEYFVNIANAFVSTVIFAYIINDCVRPQKIPGLLFSNLAVIGLMFITVFASQSPKLVFIVINIGTIICCTSQIIVWIRNLKSGRKSSYTVLDAWVLALAAYIVLKTINFIGVISGNTLNVADFEFFMPENIIFFLVTIPALTITARRYRDKIADLEKRINQKDSECRQIDDRLFLRRTVDKILITSQAAIRNMILMQRSENKYKETDEKTTTFILTSLDQGINLLTMESILEAGVPAESQAVNIEETFMECINLFGPVAQKRNIIIKTKTEGTENKSVLINKNVLTFLINSMMINTTKFCLESSKLTVILRLDSENLELQIKTMTNPELHLQTKDFIENSGRSDYLGFNLMKKILTCYGSEFITEDLGTGFSFSFSLNVVTGAVSDKGMSLISEYKKDAGIVPKPLDSLLSIEGKAPTILFAIADDISRKLTEDFLNGHCHLYTADSGDQAFKMLQTAHALGNKLPDIIISDYILPGVSGMEFFRKCNSEDYLKDIPFVFILPPSYSDKIDNLMSLGVTDCITAPFTMKRILRAIYSIYSMTHKIRRSVVNQVNKLLMGDQTFISPQQIPEKQKAKEDSLPLTSSQSMVFAQSELSAREKQIAMLIADGLTDKEIAEKLNISIGTVTTHNKKIFKKMDVHSRIELVNKVR